MQPSRTSVLARAAHSTELVGSHLLRLWRHAGTRRMADARCSPRTTTDNSRKSLPPCRCECGLRRSHPTLPTHERPQPNLQPQAASPDLVATTPSRHISPGSRGHRGARGRSARVSWPDRDTCSLWKLSGEASAGCGRPGSLTNAGHPDVAPPCPTGWTCRPPRSHTPQRPGAQPPESSAARLLTKLIYCRRLPIMAAAGREYRGRCSPSATDSDP